MKKIINKVSFSVRRLCNLAIECHTIILIFVVFVMNVEIIKRCSGELWIGLISSSCSTILIVFNEIIRVLYEEKEKFPVPKRRYTIKDKNGDIKVKEADIQLAIIYLSQIEDYIERNALNDE